ncbi:hypothetical protein KTR10_01395 [Candidatus Kaiserbacteria bacterium]|nr:hypothetical protein [Candidatus Kaiserbacteria bacterium]
MKNRIVLGAIALVAIVVVVLAVLQTKSEKWNGVKGESIDVAIEFYTGWLELQGAEGGEDATKAFLKEAPLAESLKQTVKENLSSEVDLIACRPLDEVQLRTQVVFEREDTAQYIMQIAKGELTDGYAVVDLVGKNGEWQIENITCAYGDVAPERGEFNFDQAGGLLKNVPAPYDANFWHLVYETEGQIGVVPLHFTEASECITLDGDTVSCNGGFLVEAMDVHVYGHLSEEGAEVVRVEAQ